MRAMTALLVPTLALVLAANALASAADTATPAAEAPATVNGAPTVQIAGLTVIDDRRACTRADGVHSFEAVDREHVIVEGPGNRNRFLVRISGACSGNPKWETRIGIVSRDSRLCGFDGDDLVVDGQRCSVLDMWRLAPAATQKAAKADE